MIIIKTVPEMMMLADAWHNSVGFVPTMGYLHEGHLSLLRESQNTCTISVVSIFVNPAQFAPNEDLSSYPRDLDRDVSLLENLNVDYLFLPNVEEMYPKNYKTWVNVEELTTVLCGKCRPTHFRGVTTILVKLINIVRPSFMFMGEKDYQQLMVTKQMVADLHFPTRVIGCPILRENDGLAMSSRNKYLHPLERNQATCLYQALLLAQECVLNNIFISEKIKQKMNSLIQQQNGKVDYIEIVHPETLQSLQEINSDVRVVLAVFIGKTRLIDNMLIHYGKS
jgi:pantoate--beta-alanine ligase